MKVDTYPCNIMSFRPNCPLSPVLKLLQTEEKSMTPCESPRGTRGESRVSNAFDDGQNPIRQHGARSLSGQPFLKWPGGKRWLDPEITSIVEWDYYLTYREPL